MSAMAAMSDRAELRKKIISAVLEEYELTSSQFFSKRRPMIVVEARKQAANLLREAGFSWNRVAQILKMDQSTVRHYADRRYGDRKRHRQRAIHAFARLPDPSKDFIARLAEKKGISIISMMIGWILDRVEIEGGQSCRH